MSHVTRTRTGIRAAAAVVFAAVVGVSIGSIPFATTAGAATTAPALSQFDARLLADINHARAAHGERALRAVAGTTDVAHGWSCHMAADLTLAHNGRLGSLLDSHGSSLWTTYGENVGYTTATAGADRLFHDYMNSPLHRANILNRSYRYVGIWSKRSNGRRWNTIDFVGSTVSSYNYGYGITRRTC